MHSRTWVVIGTSLSIFALLAGCGGGGGGAGDSRRTDLACSPSIRPDLYPVCYTLHSDVPVPMSCDPLYGEVDACPDAQIFATCAWNAGPAQGLLRVYTMDFQWWKFTCGNAQPPGTWTEY